MKKYKKKLFSRKTKLTLIIIFILIIIPLSLSTFSKNSVFNITSTIGENDRYSEKEYYGYLSIPSIDMNLGFYDYESPLNNVEYNIELIKIPVENSYLLAGHSGNGAKALFNGLHKLVVGDDIYLKINDNKTHYIITDIYRVEKVGSIKIKNISGMIYLTTCDQVIKGYQLVIEGVKV